MKVTVKKHIIPSELSYLLGLIFIALGVAFMAHADLGVSMLVAPAHVIHNLFSHKLELSFITLGMVEFAFQVLLLLVICLVLRRFKITYLWAFVTTFIYGIILDAILLAVLLIPTDFFIIRVLLFIVGCLCMSIGVAFMFRTYIAPEIYELLVIEIAETIHYDIHKFKTWFDCACCILAIILEFAIFGLWTFEAVQIGTIIFAVFNGTLISIFGKYLDKHFDFERKIKKHK